MVWLFVKGLPVVSRHRKSFRSWEMKWCFLCGCGIWSQTTNAWRECLVAKAHYTEFTMAFHGAQSAIRVCVVVSGVVPAPSKGGLWKVNTRTFFNTPTQKYGRLHPVTAVIQLSITLRNASTVLIDENGNCVFKVRWWWCNVVLCALFASLNKRRTMYTVVAFYTTVSIFEAEVMAWFWTHMMKIVHQILQPTIQPGFHHSL